MTRPVAAVLLCPQDATWVCCRNCGVPFEIHQPDADEPRRFVGRCDGCGRRYLLAWVPRSADGLRLMLPTNEELQAAFNSRGA